LNSPAYALSARQQLSVSPRLQQAVRLLQMSTLEFTQELQLALETNPFLEEPDADDEVAAETPAAPEAEEVLAESLVVASAAPRDDGSNNDPYAWISEQPSLREHLRTQLCGGGLEERERLAAELIVETLDDDGYLREDPAETAAALALDPSLTGVELQAGLCIVQMLDPAGVGARSLGECLALQLRAMDPARPGHALALKIVHGQLELLARNDYTALQQRLDCSQESLRQARALIRSLDPRPGERFGKPTADYVVPDVIVFWRNGQLNSMINPAVMPRARLNHGYVDMFRQVRRSGYAALSQQLQEARWLLKNVEQRFATIQRVADAIVARQRAFFAYGEIALRPLVLREIADELQLHESTVSRATGNKYMATPRGVFEFKHFFSRQLATGTGGSCSAAAVRALMREMIEAENACDPLSDVSLAHMLHEQGIRVARRTVAKYRNLLKLPPAELRRHS